MSTNIETLLNKISRIVAKEKTLQEERRKRGENFNIFSVLNLSTSEVRLHSAFLAELLNPNGDHGLGYKFLEAFLSNIIQRVKPGFEFDIKSAKVSKEFSIGPISADYTEGGQIDLLIRDDKNHAIVIENKIDANDQEKQLLRYDNYAKKNTTAYVLLYLTKYGDEASEYSTCNQVEYQRISYREDILSWLQSCICIAALHPIVRETIRQYRTNLNDILSNMEHNNLSNMLNILTSEDNVLTTIDIFTQNFEIQKKIRENFIKKISDKCEKLGFNFECDDGVKTVSNESWIKIYEEETKDVQFRIGVHKNINDDGFRMCFVSLTRESVKEEYKFWPNGNYTKDYPLGWVYLWSETGEPYSGDWWRWDNWLTLRDMANGKMLSFIYKQLLKIKEENIFRKMDDLLE